MTISRSRLVDTDVTRWYHCISRCVRRAVLLSEDGSPGRKDWIDMDNHLHFLLRIDVGGLHEPPSPRWQSDVVGRSGRNLYETWQQCAELGCKVA